MIAKAQMSAALEVIRSWKWEITVNQGCSSAILLHGKFCDKRWFPGSVLALPVHY